MKWDPKKAQEAVEELAQILFHTYWSNAPGFYRESSGTQDQWRSLAEEALKFTHQYYIDKEKAEIEE